MQQPRFPGCPVGLRRQRSGRRRMLLGFAATVGGLLSPIAPSQQVRSQIEQNIRASFHAFEDRDHDGHAD